MTPHKHAVLIKAWADGAEIQYKSQGMSDRGTWYDFTEDHPPSWWENTEYRIKPMPKSKGELLWEAFGNNSGHYLKQVQSPLYWEEAAEKFLAALKEQQS